MTTPKARRAAYELAANEIDMLIERHNAETWWSDDDWNQILAELQQLRDELAAKADPEAMREAASRLLTAANEAEASR